ncbi:Uncharacterised protein [uncultured archaeon]|nr:Uncharacterised protein [uncultured archaeon]
MLSIPDVDVDSVAASISWSISPDPLAPGRPVLHHLPDIARGGAFQPELVEHRISIRISSRCRPLHEGACVLRTGLVRQKRCQPRRLIGPEHCEQSPCIIIPSRRTGMETVPHLHLNFARSCIRERGRPGPARVRGPVAHQLPQPFCGRPLQPVPVEHGIVLGIYGRGHPADGCAHRLRAGSAGGQKGDHRRLVQINDEVAVECVVIRSGRPGMLAISNRHQHLAVADIDRSCPPDPAVVPAPAGLIHPESAGGRTAQEEPVLQWIALGIKGQSGPLDPASCKLRRWPVGEERFDHGRQVGAAEGEGDGLLDVEAVWPRVLAIPDPDLNLVGSWRVAEGAPGPEAARRVAGVGPQDRAWRRSSHKEPELQRIALRVSRSCRPDYGCARSLRAGPVRD